MQRALGPLQASPPTRKLTSCPERLRPHSCRSGPPDLGHSGVQLRPLLPSSCLQMGKLRPSQGRGAWITLHNKFKSGTGPAGPADTGPACFTELSSSLCPNPTKHWSPTGRRSCRAGEDSCYLGLKVFLCQPHALCTVVTGLRSEMFRIFSQA